MSKTIFVTGATGKTGRRLTALLNEQGAIVRAASRKPVAGQIMFDWQAGSTHRAALAGTDAIYLVPPALVEDPVPVVAPFLDAAYREGVRRVVLVSSMGAGFVSEPPESGRRRLEALVRSSEFEWTTLRPSGFMQNFSEGFLLPAVRNGAIPNPAGDGKVAMVDAGDIAAVAAVVLTGGAHLAGAVHDVTGPSAIGYAEIAEIIAEAAGRPVLARDMTSSQFLTMLEGAGVPSDYAAMLVRDQEAIRDGEAAGVSDTVERLTGREARSFIDYCGKAAEAWR